MAILGLLLVATMFCGCTSSDKSTATAKVTAAPTTAVEKTTAPTHVATVEQTQKIPATQEPTR